MKISRNWLKTYFAQEIPSAVELAELFTFHSFEVEGIVDSVLDVKILPDRAHYCLSHQGVAQEISVLTGQPLKPNRIPKGPEASIGAQPKITVEVPNFCRRYIGRYVENIKMEKSLPWACSFLEVIGQRAINSVVDATNMVMYDIGQPMHAFDADKIKGRIVVRAARKGEKIELLDSSEGVGREVELLETDYVIADELGPVAIAGVKGGKRTGVTETTTRILLESANFDPTAVRRTATRLNLRSEASKRYENEITPELAGVAMDNISALLQETSKDSKFGPPVDVYPTRPTPTIIEFDPSCLVERLGVSVPLSEAEQILKRMGIMIEKTPGSQQIWRLTIPANRFDLTIKEDIVEEVGRVYGYEHIIGILPDKTGEPAILPVYYLSEMIKNFLVDQGFFEVSLYTLVARGEIEMAYPLARDKAFARANLTDGLLACLEKNLLNADLLGLEEVKIFEIGRDFSVQKESNKLALGFVPVKKIKGQKSEERLFASLKLLVEKLQSRLRIDEPSLIESPRIVSKGNCVVCEIDLDQVLEKTKFPAEASYGDLVFTVSGSARFQKFSQYPFIVRDVAVFVPETVSADQVWSSIQKSLLVGNGLELLVRHSLFDTFKKEGKVSYAFRLIFQSMERTLTDQEIGKIVDKVYADLKSNGWEVR